MQYLTLDSLVRTFRWMLVFFALMWGTVLVNSFLWNLNVYGIIPRTYGGLLGIVCATFLHADLSVAPQHVMQNTVSLLFLLPVLLLFYPREATRVVCFIVLLCGCLVWLFGRGDSIHIGASGLIFGLLAFLFLGGFIRRQWASILASVVLFLMYSVLVYGIVPKNFSDVWLVLLAFFDSFIQGVSPQQLYVSWEAHLAGALAGILAAFFFLSPRQDL